MLNRKRGSTESSILGIILIIIIIIGVVFALVWFLFSFETVDELQYGIKQHSMNRTIDESKVYGAGRHDVGIFYDMIRFPATAQSIEYFTPEEDEGREASLQQLTSRSRDGLSVDLDISFNYRLRKSDLFELYRTFGTNYRDTYIAEGRSSLRDAASSFNAIELFNNRTGVQNLMQNLLGEALLGMYADLVFFRLHDVNLPDDFEEALRRVQVAQQEKEIAEFEQAAAVVRAQTKILEAQANANVTVLEASAGAEAFLINMKAQAEAVNISLAAEASGYYIISQQLGLNSTELLTYLWIQAIMEHESSLLIIGLDTPAIWLNTETSSTP